MPSKDDQARELAQKHYQIEDGITEIYRVIQSQDVELNPSTPVILLEGNSNTVPSGVTPIQFGPDPASVIYYPTVIVEVTPEELKKIRTEELGLPAGWNLGALIPRQNESINR